MATVYQFPPALVAPGNDGKLDPDGVVKTWVDEMRSRWAGVAGLDDALAAVEPEVAALVRQFTESLQVTPPSIRLPADVAQEVSPQIDACLRNCIEQVASAYKVRGLTMIMRWATREVARRTGWSDCPL